jgi:hypothetical protein
MRTKTQGLFIFLGTVLVSFGSLLVLHNYVLNDDNNISLNHQTEMSFNEPENDNNKNTNSNRNITGSSHHHHHHQANDNDDDDDTYSSVSILRNENHRESDANPETNTTALLLPNTLELGRKRPIPSCDNGCILLFFHIPKTGA